jgi:hypothetical protein
MAQNIPPSTRDTEFREQCAPLEVDDRLREGCEGREGPLPPQSRKMRAVGDVPFFEL